MNFISRDIVAELYRGILQREPDPDGLIFWLKELQSGMPLNVVIGKMLDSEEFLSQGQRRYNDTIHAFSQDWFTTNIPLFEKYLAHLKNRPCQIIEIGAHEGRSTTWLLEHILTHEEAHIISIDVYLQRNFWRNVAASNGLQKIQFLRGPSGDMLRRMNFGSMDFIYIDGSHSMPDVLEDAVLSFPLLKCGGVMAFDDYLWQDPRWGQEGFPKPAIDAFLTAYDARIELLEKNHQVWLRKINDRPLPPNEPAFKSIESLARL